MGISHTKYLAVEDLEEVFESNGSEIYTYLEILCRNPGDASDLLQQVFLKFIVKVKEGSVLRKTYGNYLKKIARNEFINKMRRESKEILLPDQETVQDDQEKVRVEADSRQIRIVFLESLSKPELPEEIAAVLRLRFIKGASLEEICEETEKSRATVYRLMEKGMQFLAASYKNAGLHVQDLDY